MTPKHLHALMQHAPARMKMGPEDAEAYRFANALREATLKQRLRAVWTHPANELANAPSRAAKVRAGLARALGMIPGASDYLFMWSTGSLVIEFKSKTGSLNPNQRAFRDWCADMEVPFHICRSAEQGLQILRDAGVLD